MTCRRQTGATEQILLGVINKLSPIDIDQATGKTTDNYYKCSNMNNNRKLHFDDAWKLDRKLLEIGKEAEFLPLFISNLSEAGGISCMTTLCLSLTKEIGEYAAAVQDGADIDKLRSEIQDVIRVATQIDRSLMPSNFEEGPSYRSVIK